MKYEWAFVRKGLFFGLLLTGLDVFMVVSGLWREGGELWLVMLIGPIFLVSSCLLTFAYVLIAHHGTSYLPENWEELSFEEKHDFAEKRAREEHKRLSLWILRLNDPQRHHIKGDISQREK